MGETISGRDRLIKIIGGLGVDRAPIAPFIHANFVKAFFRDQDVDVVTQTVAVYEAFGFDIIHRNCTPAYDDIGIPGSGWEVERTVACCGRDRTTTTVVHTPKGDLREVHRLAWVSDYDAEATPVEYLIKSEGDLDLMIAFQPSVATMDTSPIVLAAEALGDRGLTAPWVQGAFNHVAFYYRPLDQLVVDALADPPFYHRMMKYFLSRNMAIVSQLIRAGADMLSYGGNIASGKMVSSSFFREHVLPYEKRLINFVQSAGVPVLYHNCGYAKNLFPAYRELGMLAYESLTALPYGDTALEEAFELLGPGMVLSGGIDQIEFLRKAGPDEVRRKVKETLDKAKGRGRFILGTSDYLHELTPHENVAALAEAGVHYGECCVT